MPSFVLVILLLIVMIEGGFTENQNFEGKSDLLGDLPGQPPAPKLNHYAGYVTLGEGRAQFYWFQEAMEDPMEKPLVLWLNGGPGCSTIAAGAIKEIGYFLITSDGFHLRLNPYSWNKVANVIFVDSPVGVGFSYTNYLDSESFNDQLTAEDSYTFLTNWFSKFPMYKSHEFYIAGESYGGHYLPQLAEVIHEKNKIATNNFINLKALLIGNPLLDWISFHLSRAKYSWNNGIISSNLYQTVLNECDPNPKDHSKDNWSKDCMDANSAVRAKFTNIEINHIYMRTCSNSSSEPESESSKKDPLIAHDPCANSIMEVYLNRPDVQKALHVDVTSLLPSDVQKALHVNVTSLLPYPFSICSKAVRAKYNSYQVPTVVPLVRKLLDLGYPIWIFSGDADGNVVMDSTRSTIISMNLTEKPFDKWGGWRKWHYEGQVGGWMVEYKEGLTFITVRGAGHMVPAYAPERALFMFSHFLKGEALPFEGDNNNA